MEVQNTQEILSLLLKRLKGNLYLEENCQNYVKRLFNANGISQFDVFIGQKVRDLVPSIVQKLARGVTDVAGVIDYFKHGGGL